MRELPCSQNLTALNVGTLTLINYKRNHSDMTVIPISTKIRQIGLGYEVLDSLHS